MQNIYCKYDELKDCDAIVPNPKNYNKHPEKQINKIARVLELNGVRHPIIISKRSGFIIAGHARLEAAKKNGWKQMPVVYQEFNNEAAEYSFLISDNKVAELSETDNELLNDLLIELGPELDIDATGLDASDLEKCADDELKEPAKAPRSCPHCGGAL